MEQTMDSDGYMPASGSNQPPDSPGPPAPPSMISSFPELSQWSNMMKPTSLLSEGLRVHVQGRRGSPIPPTAAADKLNSSGEDAKRTVTPSIEVKQPRIELNMSTSRAKDINLPQVVVPEQEAFPTRKKIFKDVIPAELNPLFQAQGASTLFEQFMDRSNTSLKTVTEYREPPQSFPNYNRHPSPTQMAGRQMLSSSRGSPYSPQSRGTQRSKGNASNIDEELGLSFAQIRELEREKQILEESVHRARNVMLSEQDVPAALVPKEQIQYLKNNAEKVQLQDEINKWKSKAESLEDKNHRLEKDIERITTSRDKALAMASELQSHIETIRETNDLRGPSAKILELHNEKKQEELEEVQNMELIQPTSPREYQEAAEVTAVTDDVKEQFREVAAVDLDKLMERGIYRAPAHNSMEAVRTDLDAQIEALEREMHLSEAKRYQTENNRLLYRRNDLCADIKRIEAQIKELDDQIESNRIEMEKHSVAELACESRAKNLKNRLETLALEEQKNNERIQADLEAQRLALAQQELAERRGHTSNLRKPKRRAQRTSSDRGRVQGRDLVGGNSTDSGEWKVR